MSFLKTDWITITLTHVCRYPSEPNPGSFKPSRPPQNVSGGTYSNDDEHLINVPGDSEHLLGVIDLTGMANFKGDGVTDPKYPGCTDRVHNIAGL